MLLVQDTKNMRDKRTRRTLDKFVVHQATPEADMVTAAEVAHVYHTVMHALSYNSADCALKLTLRTLNDSSIAKMMSCGRTKAEAVVTDVLSPKATEEVIKTLKSGGNSLPFSLHTDASNKGNRKMFPLAVQFFTPKNGVVNKVLDFFENPDESAEGIVKTIRSSLQNMGLSLDDVSAFSADNANVNYEVNSEILRGNCHAHIVHNTVKKALDKLSIDVENIVLKIYSFFSTSAKRRESLKEFCEFCDVEFHEILRHVVTRWLSLNPAITRLLQNWVPLKSYLISIGEECPKHLKELLKLTEDAVDEEEADTVEVYLLFCNNVLSMFEEVVKNLEKNATTSVDLYSIMDCFLKKLVQRRNDAFYGYLTRQKLQRLPPSAAEVARQEFTAFLNTAISYVEKWFDFSEENWLFHLQPLSLASGKISFDDIENISKRLHLVGRLNISMDQVYDECVTANSLLEHLTTAPQEKKWQSKGTAERWMLVLQAADIPNIQAVVSFVLSIPSSTGFVERIFSFMKNKWTDVLN
ncbi:uncharacterized protein LOC117521185 [Thalassophryne amazonica]|uniref:uncharacterized protein LOC117521185 n=1 Tax=Thalassophryne amazonica TaxID=390379 RepID=UPI001470C4B7|nr:uncharacterized protein LOC117521185 [Thalassophryne amazonica]